MVRNSRWARAHRRAAVLATISCIAASTGALVPAVASAETFMSSMGLSAGNAYASYGAHPYIYLVDHYSDHTSCPAIASGYAGYTSTPFSGGNNTAYVSSNCGYYYQAWYPNPVSAYLHGAEYNPNVSTFTTFNYADYYW